jgi:hypothetical protein
MNLLLRATLSLWIMGLPLWAASTNLLWRWSNPLPFGATLTDLAARANEPTIAVAEYGQIFSSTDLVSWNRENSGTTRWLRSATYFGTTSTNTARLLVISGQTGTVLVSDDNSSFKSIDLATTDWLEGVAASPTRLVAVGDSGAVYTSDEGTNWIRRTSAAIGTTWLRSVTWRTNGVFCAVGEGGLVATSPNGITWTRQVSRTTANLNRVVPISTGFCAVGDAGTLIVDSSGSGTNFRVVSSGATGDLFAIAQEVRPDVLINPVGALLVSGDSELRSGVLAVNLWSDETDVRRTSPAPKSLYLAGYWNTTNAVFAGAAGIVTTGTRPSITSGFNWTVPDSPPRSWLFGMTTNTAYGTNTSATFSNNAVVLTTRRTTNHFAIAAGDGPTVLQSDRGITWTTALLPTNAAGAVYLGVAAQPGLLVAVGSRGVISRSTVGWEPLISTNTFTNSSGAAVRVLITNQINTLGLAWSASTNAATNTLQGIGASPARFVASGSAGILLTSTNGASWSRVSSPTTAFLTSVDFGTPGWIATGEKGTVLTSPDGLSWSARNSGTTQWLWRTRWLGSSFVAVGDNGTVRTSPDGVTWSARNSGVTNQLHDVLRVDDTYYVVGSQGTVLGSKDTIQWTRLATLTSQSLQALAHLDGRLLAAGADGTILRATVSEFPEAVALSQWPTSESQSLFLFAGEPEQLFTLERSTDLNQWSSSPPLEISDSAGTLLYLDTTTNNPALQLFRTRQVVP